MAPSKKDEREVPRMSAPLLPREETRPLGPRIPLNKFLRFDDGPPDDATDEIYDQTGANPGGFTTVTPARFECELPGYRCYQAILDTGSSISLIRREVADRIDPDHKFRFDGPSVKLNGLGTSFTAGVLLTHLRVGATTFRGALHVVEDCPELLLGMDTLGRLRCGLDVVNEKATFKVGQEEASFRVRFDAAPKAGGGSYTIRASSARIVPAGCQMQVPVHNPVSDSPGSFFLHGWATVRAKESGSSCESDQFLTTANGLFSNSCAHVLVANHGPQAVEIYDGMPLADIEFLGKGDQVSTEVWSIRLTGNTPGWETLTRAPVKDLVETPRCKDAELWYAMRGHDGTVVPGNEEPTTRTDRDPEAWELFDQEERDGVRNDPQFPDALRKVEGFNFGKNAPKALIDLVRDMREAFTLDGTPGSVDPAKVSMKIEADTSKIRSAALRPLSPAKRDELKKTLDQLLGWSVIERSDAPIAYPIVMVQQSGKWRMCVDYRALNAVTKPDPYPMQRAEDIFNSLGGKRLFSSLDAAKGYHQIDLRAEDREKTAFITPFGLFQFRRVPFGLRNAPAVFQRYMDSLLGGLRYQNALVYIDDILVYSDNEEEHVLAVRNILTRAKADGLRFAPSKCFFGFDSLKVLGRMVSPEGLAAPPDKLAAVREMPIPDTLGKLWTFLGMTGYYRQFICKYATLAAPLYELVKGFKHRRTADGGYQLVAPDGGDTSKAKAKVILESRHLEAIDALKDALTKPPTLAFADPSRKYILYCDASHDGFGAVLTQILPVPERAADAFNTSTSATVGTNRDAETTGVPLDDGLEKI